MKRSAEEEDIGPTPAPKRTATDGEDAASSAADDANPGEANGASAATEAPATSAAGAGNPPGGEDTRKWKMFVGGVHLNVRTPELTVYFQNFGTVVDCIVMEDRMTGRSRGFGFVTMGDQAGFDAVSSKKDHELLGKWLDVKGAVEADKLAEAARPAPSVSGGDIRGSTKSIYVSNLAQTSTEQQLRDLFSPHCGVQNVAMKVI